MNNNIFHCIYLYIWFIWPCTLSYQINVKSDWNFVVTKWKKKNSKRKTISRRERKLALIFKTKSKKKTQSVCVVVRWMVLLGSRHSDTYAHDLSYTVNFFSPRFFYYFREHNARTGKNSILTSRSLNLIFFPFIYT